MVEVERDGGTVDLGTIFIIVDSGMPRVLRVHSLLVDLRHRSEN